ncbi:MAG: M28 family peptidase [Bacteroidetes bacterium]|nr:MAG: M28 family peptidase [Bacteroidota bacterium]
MRHSIIFLWSCLFLNLLIIPRFCFSKDENVMKVLDNINSDSIISFIGDLYGESQIYVDNLAYFIKSRYKLSDGNIKAAEYLRQKLLSYGLETYFQNYSLTGTNIYAFQTGTDDPDKKYYMSAHYDDMPKVGDAPGADDNASGCAIVLEAARIISQWKSKYTIIYGFFDEEEQGYVGEKYFAFNSGILTEGILGVIEIDMVGWDSNNDNVLLVRPTDHDGAIKLKNKIIELADTYDFEVKPIIKNIGCTDTLLNMYPIIGFNEDSEDFNPYYHTEEDKLSKINRNYLFNNAKLEIALLASIVELETTNFVNNNQNWFNDTSCLNIYPNPASSKIELGLLNSEKYGEVKIYSIEGYNVLVTDYKDKIDVNSLTSGLYFIKIGKRIGKFIKI